MAFRWRADNSPLIAVLDSPSPHQLKNVVKAGPPLTKRSGSALDAKGSLTLTMGKCLWFSVKIKVCQLSLSSP